MMTEKALLIKDLQYLKSFEEDAIAKLTAFYLALNWREEVDPSFHAEIERSLLTLKQDSEKHARLDQEAIDYIEASDKNEF